MHERRSLIVFRIEYDSKNGWGAVSNFITKYTEDLPMSDSDVGSVTSCVFDSSQCKSNFELVKAAASNRFRSIKRPENIYVNKGNYDYVFLINIDYAKLYDVVELQNFFLIWDANRNIRVITLITGNNGGYHKTSHYFAFLTDKKDIFYESVFFQKESDQSIRHLQTRNIGILQKFLPLLPVNCSTEGGLRQNITSMVSEPELEFIMKEGTILSPKNRLIAGACKGLSQSRDLFGNCDTKDCARQLAKLNVLAFLLFCFSVKNKAAAFGDFSEFIDTLQYISLWANGCLQLIENIVFHSRNRRGAFSFRVLEKSAGYIKEKYGEVSKEKRWIELMITDYPGCYSAQNIAEIFRENLSDPVQQADFKELLPVDFFVDRNNSAVSDAWNKYYANYTNLINHYGLKIFRNVVEKSGGYFALQSFSGHTPKQGEYYCSNKSCSNVVAVCMPGTGYSVLFALDQKAEAGSHSDFGIREFDERVRYTDALFQYEIHNIELEVNSIASTAEEKTHEIEKIAEKLVENRDAKGQKHILAVSCGGFNGSDAEILYKAISLAILQSESLIHIVMYECRRELVEMLLDAAYHFWNNLKGEVFSQKETQIALYTAELYEEIIILPGDWYSTLSINSRSNFSRETRWKDYFEQWSTFYNVSYEPQRYLDVPFEILVEGEPDTTIFEQYVRSVVQRNIQDKELGCKLENTHMRLGSTIHVNHFYEAEVLFGNALFVERFALLLLKKLISEAEDEEKIIGPDSHITLYGYTNYSEQVIFRTMQLLEEAVAGLDVDYAILERETEYRGFTHVDKIRYSHYFKSQKERREYFGSRKIICIIPIASTLKTNEKLINLFCEKNGKECRENFIYNFELILVGSQEENQYWKKDGKKIIGNIGMEIAPIPEFFVEVNLKYLEPLECPMCFPERIVDEVPLVEVNAASTIPNQAFGIIEDKKRVLSAQEIRKAESRMSVLRDVMLYRHLQRGENHYLFYFQTNLLILLCREEIKAWLREIKNKVQLSKDDFVVLFCPSHFSNAGFVEYVNSIVFHGAAVVLRDDVDKEYRCNFKTKYSNLRGFVEKMFLYNEQGNVRKKQLRFFYIDDAIISGRTFQRSKSLVQSIIDRYPYSQRQRYVVFDGAFVLLDRNSRSSRWQYVGVDEDENHFFAFQTLHISSLRNHGDACVLCNLENESRILKESAVTRGMFDYWDAEEVKFSPRPVGAHLQIEQQKYDSETPKEHLLRQKKEERAFRRLVCTNNANIFLDDNYHGNKKKEALKQLITLVLEGCSIQKEEERAEYFLSYCKVLSRPFRVFDKAIKEAIFDFLLVMGESTISGKTCEEIIKGSEKKEYLKEAEIFELFIRAETFVADYFKSETQKRDLILVLLKQLTEMKSNFIIRVEIMNYLSEYAKTLEEKARAKFYDYYQRLVKKLLGISSDTSKSLWFDRVLFQKKEKEGADLLRLSGDLNERFYLENVRVYQDAYKKLDDRLKTDYTDWENHFCKTARDITKEELARFGAYVEQYIKVYQFKDFITIMEQYGFYEEKQLTEAGKILVAANVLLHRYILSEFEGDLGSQHAHEEERNLDKCNYIATYINYILGSEETIIVMELDAEYDAWEDILIDRYNKLAGKEGEPIAKKKKKEYIILGGSKPNRERETVREADVVNHIQQLQGGQGQGYSCDLDKHIFQWELGQDAGHPVYVYAQWGTLEDGKDTFDAANLNRIRNVMQYYWKLNKHVFNRSNNGFFHELVATRKKLLIHSRYKAHSHTKNDIRLIQFDHVINKEQFSPYYQAELLRLLADLNVSEYYRNSLTKDYYLSPSLIYTEAWNCSLSIFKNVKNFYVMNSDGRAQIETVVSYDVIFDGDRPLRDEEKIVIFDHTNAERDLFLLLYSLITNAATVNRGLVEDGQVTVYLSRTADDQLRIANVVGENTGKITALQLNTELAAPPDGEKQGISLWSMSRYVKKVTACMIRSRLAQIERMPQGERTGQLEILKGQIIRMLSEEFATYVTIENVNGEKYFSVVVPVLAEKYHEFL